MPVSAMALTPKYSALSISDSPEAALTKYLWPVDLFMTAEVLAPPPPEAPPPVVDSGSTVRPRPSEAAADKLPCKK